MTLNFSMSFANECSRNLASEKGLPFPQIICFSHSRYITTDPPPNPQSQQNHDPTQCYFHSHNAEWPPQLLLGLLASCFANLEARSASPSTVLVVAAFTHRQIGDFWMLPCCPDGAELPSLGEITSPPMRWIHPRILRFLSSPTPPM
eukprot:TRINITY_DN19279_c0_g1_i1.p1 TRINITY_DN19279_c0_g1~~TRINITY_DN19279_c0_g1_i1.p1  ORF type:complete len:147 (+),score=9.17 TRINITY_DN19279_c0_g1_i1:435-875(+)